MCWLSLHGFLKMGLFTDKHICPLCNSHISCPLDDVCGFGFVCSACDRSWPAIEIKKKQAFRLGVCGLKFLVEYGYFQSLGDKEIADLLDRDVYDASQFADLISSRRVDLRAEQIVSNFEEFFRKKIVEPSSQHPCKGLT